MVLSTQVVEIQLKPTSFQTVGAITVIEMEFLETADWPRENMSELNHHISCENVAVQLSNFEYYICICILYSNVFNTPKGKGMD